MFFDTGFLKSDELFLKLAKTAEADAERQFVPAYHFRICLVDGTEIGSCDLRIGHNQKTYYGGNIGYSVKPEYRGRHYAGKACLLLFELAKKHGMEFVRISCGTENAASARSCEFAGGVLEATVDLPPESDMYLEGLRRVHIYRFAL